jgi:hypothetical protein
MLVAESGQQCHSDRHDGDDPVPSLHNYHRSSTLAHLVCGVSHCLRIPFILLAASPPP